MVFCTCMQLKWWCPMLSCILQFLFLLSCMVVLGNRLHVFFRQSLWLLTLLFHGTVLGDMPRVIRCTCPSYLQVHLLILRPGMLTLLCKAALHWWLCWDTDTKTFLQLATRCLICAVNHKGYVSKQRSNHSQITHDIILTDSMSLPQTEKWDGDPDSETGMWPVSYTHLTLPTMPDV